MQPKLYFFAKNPTLKRTLMVNDNSTSSPLNAFSQQITQHYWDNTRKETRPNL